MGGETAGGSVEVAQSDGDSVVVGTGHVGDEGGGVCKPVSSPRRNVVNGRSSALSESLAVLGARFRLAGIYQCK